MNGNGNAGSSNGNSLLSTYALNHSKVSRPALKKVGVFCKQQGRLPYECRNAGNNNGRGNVGNNNGNVNGNGNAGSNNGNSLLSTYALNHSKVSYPALKKVGVFANSKAGSHTNVAMQVTTMVLEMLATTMATGTGTPMEWVRLLALPLHSHMPRNGACPSSCAYFPVAP